MKRLEIVCVQNVRKGYAFETRLDTTSIFRLWFNSSKFGHSTACIPRKGVSSDYEVLRHRDRFPYILMYSNRKFPAPTLRRQHWGHSYEHASAHALGFGRAHITQLLKATQLINQPIRVCTYLHGHGQANHMHTANPRNSHSYLIERAHSVQIKFPENKAL